MLSRVNIRYISIGDSEQINSTNRPTFIGYTNRGDKSGHYVSLAARIGCQKQKYAHMLACFHLYYVFSFILRRSLLSRARPLADSVETPTQRSDVAALFIDTRAEARILS